VHDDVHCGEHLRNPLALDQTGEDESRKNMGSHLDNQLNVGEKSVGSHLNNQLNNGNSFGPLLFRTSSPSAYSRVCLLSANKRRPDAVVKLIVQM
jgi:hypothetical protein